MVAQSLKDEIRRAYLAPRERLGILPGDPVDPEDGLPTMKGLARAYGVSEYAVWRYVTGRTNERLMGRSCGRHLSPQETCSVADMYGCGVPVVVIAEVYRVSRQTVSRLGRAAGHPPRRGRTGVPNNMTAASYLASLQSTGPRAGREG